MKAVRLRGSAYIASYAEKPLRIANDKESVAWNDKKILAYPIQKSNWSLKMG